MDKAFDKNYGKLYTSYFKRDYLQKMTLFMGTAKNRNDILPTLKYGVSSGGKENGKLMGIK